MVVLIEQLSHPCLLVRRIERRWRNVAYLYWLAVEGPQKWADITFIIQPGAQPLIVAARHELARHFAMRGRQWLEEMKDARVANRPGYKHDDKCEREQRPGNKDAREREARWQSEPPMQLVWSSAFRRAFLFPGQPA